MSRLRVQTILYGHRPESVDRWLQGVVATISHAESTNLSRLTSVVLGDCSPTSVVTLEWERRWARQLELTGVEFDVMRFGSNLGHGRGHNILATGGAADTDLMLVLNPDGVPAATMLTEMLRALRPRVAAVEARQSPFEHPKAYDPGTGATSWVSGAAVLLRADAFSDVGGFDADTFFLHGDDVDLSWRLRLAGWDLIHAPQAIFVHNKRVGRDGRVIAPAAEQFHGSLGALMLLHKYSRPDAVQHWEHHIRESGNEVQGAALAEFQRRRLARELPEPIDPAHIVSEVIDANFGPYRF